MTAVALQRGQRVRLDPGPVASLELRLELDAPEAPHLLVVELGPDRRATATQAVSWRGPDGARAGVLALDTIGSRTTVAIALDQARPEQRFLYALAFDDRPPGPRRVVGDVTSGRLEVVDRGQVVGAWDFTGSAFGPERSVELVEVYCKDGSWRFHLNGTGYGAGVAGLLNRLGMEHDLPPRVGSTVADRSTGLPSSAPPAGAGPGPGSVDLPLPLPATWPGGREPSGPRDLAGAIALLVVDNDEGGGTGTGFFIGPGGHLVTAQHVVAGATAVTVFPDRAGTARPAVVLVESERHDLALLWCVDTWGATDWLLFDDRQSDLGDEVGMLAYPLGTALGNTVTYAQGFVSGVRDDDGVPYLQYDLTSAPGTSGGPVFVKATGKVLAVHHGGLSVEGHGMVARFGLSAANLFDLGWLARPPA